ncbi:MAG: Cbb3-type cytochrome oxidase component FixQ [Pseudomonadota bacterium]|jgi:cbb3-type cytochrome oxidase subunit 3
MSELHTALTVLFFVIFVGIIAVTYSKGQRGAMEKASRIPLEDDDPTEQQTKHSKDRD